jgi:hypothetical protein
MNRLLRGLGRLLGGCLNLSALHWCRLARRNLLSRLPGLIGLRILGWSFQVLPGLVEFFVKLLTGFPKLIHTLTQTPRQLGKLLSAEQNKHDYKNQYPFSRPWRHESDGMHSLNRIAGGDEFHPKPARVVN